MNTSILAAGIAPLFLLPTLQASTPKESSLETSAAAAMTQPADSKLGALAKLRQAGPAGLDALMNRNRELLERMRSGATPLSDPTAAKLREALDTVARQRDAYASGLFWYTDFEAAKAAAKASGKRILSLRLLGQLDEEFSCANSRFFRTTLYANEQVSSYLRNNYILHWKSVRPVPRITIDMGDGRRIERTITGNSIHYVLNADGTVLDALPGLYGPSAFLEALHRTDSIAQHSTLQRSTASTNFHAQEAVAISRRWLRDLGQVGESSSASASAQPALLPANVAITFQPSASLAARRAVSKFGPERPILRQMMPDGRAILDASNPEPPQNGPARVVITGLAESRNIEPITLGDRSEARLAQPASVSTASLAISKMAAPPPAIANPTALQAAIVARSKSAGETPILRRMMPNGNLMPTARAQGTFEIRPFGLTSANNFTPKNFDAVSGSAVRLSQPVSYAPTITVPPMPTASQAAPRALGKAALETPILRETMPDARLLLNPSPAADTASGKTLAERTTPALWKKLADLHQSEAQLDEASRRFMMSKLPAASVSRAERAAGRALGASTPFAKTLQNFEHSIAEDTVRNEYLLHLQIHEWLATNPQLATDVEALNQKVYAELFLTPNQDPWLGLVPENIYTALEDDGCPLDGGRSR